MYGNTGASALPLHSSRPSSACPQRGFGTFAGGADHAERALLSHKERPRAGFWAVLICLLAPCAEFAAVCGALSFHVRHASPALAWIAVAAASTIAIGCVYIAASTVWKRLHGETMRDPFWYIHLAFSVVVAWGAACWLGQLSWYNNMLPYTELQALSVRAGLDPATASGRQLMDVGRIVFDDSAHIDLNRSAGFKNIDMYCVAPIVGNSSEELPSYDFWAIGLNCCSGVAGSFHCGDYDKPKAHAGLRVVREDQRSLYSLAVQQAEAAYSITADFPVFFYWMEDPEAELQSYKDEAKRCFELGTLAFAALQLLLVVVGMVLHAKF